MWGRTVWFLLQRGAPLGLQAVQAELRRECLRGHGWRIGDWARGLLRLLPGRLPGDMPGGHGRLGLGLFGLSRI